jgi:hypothetical protein
MNLGCALLSGARFGLLFCLMAGPLHAQETALAPGLGLGGSFGMTGFGGDANAQLDRGTGWEIHLSGAMRGGLYLRGGLALSKHGVEGESTAWQFRSFFLEPRWFALSLSPRIAPFIAARAGWVSEKVPGRTWELKASGVAWGGGAGLLLRVAPQISLEGGVLVGRSRFDAYDFVGEFAWKDCLDGLDAGTPLPASVSQCSGSRSLGGVVALCYPPYFPERTSNCTPPEIPYEGTGRTGSWMRAWVGVNLALRGGD